MKGGIGNAPLHEELFLRSVALRSCRSREGGREGGREGRRDTYATTPANPKRGREREGRREGEREGRTNHADLGDGINAIGEELLSISP